MTPYEALMYAAKCLKTQTAFAELVGVSQVSVSKWINQSKRLPAEYVLIVENATGVSRHDLRPDIYPRETKAALYEPDLTEWDTGDYGSGRTLGANHYAR